MMLKQDPDF
uniref:Uncharacterized protein n=1 Tax=Rhizophora mucronata TaxID=61149 RepID=A0A2P2PUG6_RHIMU